MRTALLGFSFLPCLSGFRINGAGRHLDNTPARNERGIGRGSVDQVMKRVGPEGRFSGDVGAEIPT
jgi:hypothetical protein